MGLRGARMRFGARRRQILRRDCGVLYIDDDRVRTWHRQPQRRVGFCVLNDWHGGQSPMSLPQKTTLYERLMTELATDEAIYFADATHPEHQSRPIQARLWLGAARIKPGTPQDIGGAGGSTSTVR